MDELIRLPNISRTDVDPGELQAIAEKSAAAILLKIKEHKENIDSAKTDAEKAASIKTGLLRFGKTDAKVNATAEALIKTNSALVKMNDLIQESIKFTCTSVQFAQVMHKAMAHLMLTGFKDSNGNIQKLAGESREFAQLIIDEAEDFVSKQRAYEENHAELQSRLSQKDQTDAEQSRRLDEFQSFIEKISSIDERQDKAINFLLNSSRQSMQINESQYKLLQGLTKQARFVKLSLLLCVISLAVSISAIIFIYLRS